MACMLTVRAPILLIVLSAHAFNFFVLLKFACYLFIATDVSVVKLFRVQAYSGTRTENAAVLCRPICFSGALLH